MTLTTAPNILATLEQWMLSVISHPDGIEAGIACDEAREQIDMAPGHLDRIVARSQRLTSGERLQIYANAYYARLIECLREEFPTLVHVLDESTFDGFAFGYIQRFPPRSYTLADLGSRFPHYLEQTRPSDALRDDGRPSWPDFLIDLARVERTYSEVFDGPGAEGQNLLQVESLLEISPEAWPHARLIAAPCLRLLALAYPVHEYISAVRRGDGPTVPEPSPTYLAVTRRDYVVRRCQVTAAEYELLSALIAGRTVGEAIESVAGAIAGDWESLEASLQNSFQTWARATFFRAVEIVQPGSEQAALTP